MKKTRGRVVVHIVARMTVELSRRARKGRNSEAVHRRNLRAAIELIKATHAVHLVHAADHHHAEKATRNPVANLLIKTDGWITLPHIAAV